ncbi:DUF418 domain-containing protein [Stenotrophomonas rhizophila]|uniref:DUF418 domain-containing protein n=1 Tax=Stenotrophomonas rhizophila TaxID=216778 RepID=UPI000456ED67|nr:DUF418 domain-containing protein [Stenotrophomonas rhizophila]AHY59405.1 hypothetical protein DX03_12055 [Stenotrophomonas rhizophila]
MSERIDAIDAVRGFALAGILVVNSLVFASTFYGTGLSTPDVSWLDTLIGGLVSAVFELKFYLLFSFLFGYSVTLQIRSAERSGTRFMPRMLRRQAGLFVIGAIHAVLLFHGDILTTYAVLGLVLLALRKRTDRFLTTLAVILTVATGLLWAGIAVWQAGLPVLDQTDMARSMILAAAENWRDNPMQIIAGHLAALADFLPLLLLLQAPTALAMFLLGYVAGRHEMFKHLETVRQNWAGRIYTLGWLVGVPGALAYALGSTFFPATHLETAGLAVSVVTAPLLSAAMALGVLDLLSRPAAAGLRSLLAAAGRMALTNYLLQSVLLALVFHGYGLGLVNRLSMVQLVIVDGLIFAMQLLASTFWLARFRYGPLEWLLRALTRFSFTSTSAAQ